MSSSKELLPMVFLQARTRNQGEKGMDKVSEREEEREGERERTCEA